jgi:hypothetical protein
MNSHYGIEANGHNVLYNFRPHGSKDWNDLRPNCWTPVKYIFDSKSAIILHDQEPFDRKLLDIYRIEKSRNYKWRLCQTTRETLLHNQYLTIGWPIMCHSEWSSDDIKWAEDSGMITCHYFYHGLIARDWFRHWKHHGGISPNKHWQWRFLLYARDFTGSRKYRQSLINDLVPLKSMVNYNWAQDKHIPSDFSATISVDDSRTSAIHIVAETIFDQNKIHLTEKIFKPMAMMQPFILFGGAGSLNYLKKYGFKTFGEIWDESYDLETNHDRRYQMILKLINDLGNLSITQIDNLLEKSKKIVEHNQKHFFSDQFETTLLDELRSNMQMCLKRQKEKEQKFSGGSWLYQFDRLIDRGAELSTSQSKRLKDVLTHLKTADKNRLDMILKQHPWLRDRGFV